MLWALPARAQIAVVDAAAVAHTLETAQSVARQVQQLDLMLGQVKGLADTIGPQGVPVLAVPTMGNGLAQLAPSSGVTIGGQADFSSFASARSWIRGTLDLGGQNSASGIGAVRRDRALLAGRAAQDAYALALAARQDLAGLPDRARQLGAAVQAAGTLRQDVQANSAVMLAIHEQLAQIRALLAAMLELQGTFHLADNGDVRP